MKELTPEQKILLQLQEPMPHHWRIMTGKKCAAYIDARDCQARLDEVLGFNWKSRHFEITGNIHCEVSIKVNGEWITRSSAGETSRDILVSDYNLNQQKTLNVFNLKSNQIDDIKEILNDTKASELNIITQAFKDVENIDKENLIPNLRKLLTDFKTHQFEEIKKLLTSKTESLEELKKERNKIKIEIANASKNDDSDAFKRACVAFGIGRFLYSLGFYHVNSASYSSVSDKKGDKSFNMSPNDAGFNKELSAWINNNIALPEIYKTWIDSFEDPEQLVLFAKSQSHYSGNNEFKQYVHNARYKIDPEYKTLVDNKNNKKSK